MMVWFSRLYLFLFLFYSPFYLLSSLSTSSPTSPFCHPDDTSALLQFNNSLSIISKLYCGDDGEASPCQTMSWKNGTDCCRWDGVTCDDITGHVIGLNLTAGGLYGTIQSNSTLFRLAHLRTLVLSLNDFFGSQISSEFGRFENMMHLDLSGSRFSGQVAPEISYLSKLHTIDLSSNYDLRLEASTMKRIIENTTNLTHLFLSYSDMSSIAPISLMNLSSSLKSLNLSYTRLQGEFPEGMFRRPNLQVLNLNGNTNLSLSFPKYNWSSPIKELSLSSTNISIDLPYLVKCFKNLNALTLSNCHFTRSDDLTPLGNLTKLIRLNLYSNNFSGHIPWNSLNLERLNHLDLGSNKFIGHLPEICTNNSTKLCFPSNSIPLYLETLLLDDNLLNGSISTWLYSLPSLKVLYLAMNQFTGSINEFHSCSLEYLDLSQNRLHGRIPRSLFQQVNLRDLDLSSNNLSGVVGLDQFSKLNKSSCRIREFPNYQATWDLSHNFLRDVKNIPLSNSTVRFLDISYNFLRDVNIPLSNSTVQILDISYNQLQGLVPIPPPSLTVFSISNNQLTGKIPSQICNASLLQVLDLSNNRLNGSLPPCLGNFSEDLSVLDLRNNRLQGVIPQPLPQSLMSLDFNGNQLEGPLPQSLLNCKMLEVLDVGNNKIYGSFPYWLESLPELQVLILRSNQFYGPVGNTTARFPFQKLRIMDLSNNDFTGHLPRKYLSAMMESHAAEFGYMEIYSYHTESIMVDMKGLYAELVRIPIFFATIDLSRNHFLGEIPNLIGRLKSLHGLNFSHNKLSGSIPPSLGTLSNLEWLDLSSNELVGVIPVQLTDLTFLQFLKLAHNKLVGPIPLGKQFNTFENDSYIGNVGLCGVPLSKTCNNEQEHPPSPTNVQQAEDDGFDWKFIWMGYISGLVIGVSIGYIVLSSGKFDHWFSQWAGRRMWHKLDARLRGKRN